MAKSLRSTPGVKQTYNEYDPDDIYRAQKALNERINQIAETFGRDSQIYRDYVAPMMVAPLTNHVRLDKNGRLKFKTGKNDKNSNVVDVVKRMLNKSTAGEILQRTAEQMDMAINIQHAKATGKKVARRRDVIMSAKGLHQLELDVYGRLDELYEVAEEHYRNEYRKEKGYTKKHKLSKTEEKNIKQKAKEYINRHMANTKMMKDIHASHGLLSEDELIHANRYFTTRSNDQILGLNKKKRTTKTQLRGDANEKILLSRRP